VTSRAIRFFLLNHIALLVRLPLLALLVESLGVGVIVANIATLALLFVARFLIADSTIYGAATSNPQPVREPMRVVVDIATGLSDEAIRRLCPLRGLHRRTGAASSRYLPYRYMIPGIASIGSAGAAARARVLPSPASGHDTDIQVRVAPTGSALPRMRATRRT